MKLVNQYVKFMFDDKVYTNQLLTIILQFSFLYMCAHRFVYNTMLHGVLQSAEPSWLAA